MPYRPAARTVVAENNPKRYTEQAIEWIQNPDARKNAGGKLFERAKQYYSAKLFIKKLTAYMVDKLATKLG